MTLTKSLAICMLLSNVMSTQVAQDAASSSSADARADSSRCLIQQQRSKVAALQMQPLWPGQYAKAVPGNFLQEEDIVETFKNTMNSLEERADVMPFDALATAGKRENWTGEAVSVEFKLGSPDLQLLRKVTFPDYDVNGSNATVDKEILEISYDGTLGGQIIADYNKDRFYIFGFTNKTAGLANSGANRVWFGKPWKKGSKLVHGIMMTNAPGKKKWRHSIEFAKPPPEGLKMYPGDGFVGKHRGSLYVTMWCEDLLLCEDGKIVISSVTFTPDKGEGLKKPENVVNESNQSSLLEIGDVAAY